MRFFLLIALALPLAAGAQRPAAARPDSVRLTLRPARPVPGALVRLVVRGDADSVAGTLAGQPLRFRRAKDGSWLALGGIPIDADTSAGVALAWAATRDGARVAGDSITV